MKTTRVSLLAICAALAVTVAQPVTLLAQTDSTPAATSSEGSAKKDAQLLKIPTPVEEVVQLNKSGVGDPVILSYVQASARTYQLSAQDIIKLRDEGVSTEITTAMIRRGAEQRQAAAEAQQRQTEEAATTVAAAPTHQRQPTQVVEVAPAPVTYYAPVRPVSTVSVHYFGTRDNYRPVHYPQYGSSYYYAPRVSVGIGYGGYRHGYRSSARYCR